MLHLYIFNSNMQRVLQKLFVFLFLLLGFLLVVNEAVNYCLQWPDLYKVPVDKKILILGNSQSERGLNDKIIEHSINLSQAGDAHFYTYYKLKKVLETNPQLKYVLLIYTNNNFFVEMDNWIFDEQHIGFKYPKYGHLISISDKFFLLRNNPGSFLVACRDAFRTNLQLLLHKPTFVYKKLEWGKYESLDGVIDYSKPHKQIDGFYADSSISKIDLQYLLKIDAVCKKLNRKIILIRMPMHKTFDKTNDLEVFQMYKSDLSHLPLWDYMDYLKNDSLFVDPQHINTAGANEMSKLINARFKTEFDDLK